MHSVRTICFDLDDTLWDMTPVIPRAERILYQWLADNYPRVTTVFTPAEIRELRSRAAAQWPEFGHDLTALRLQVLRQIADAAGYDEAMVRGAFDVFIEARNAVTLYSDVLPALAELSRDFRLIALSNGNADLERIGIAQHFDAAFSARDFGVAKPHSRFFELAAARSGSALSEMLHIGDHPENDVTAAERAGMRAVWLNRKGQPWPDPEPPTHEISALGELRGLLLP